MDTSLIGLAELCKPKPKKKSQIKYVTPQQPFVKIREKGTLNTIPFHEGYGRKEINTTYYRTGSSYVGSVDRLGFSGRGVYKYPHGVVYEGEFLDGQFHGQGVLTYPRGQKLEGKWYKGKLMSSTFKTGEHGDIEFKEDEFLVFPVRVEDNETDENDMLICNELELAHPKHEIPEGCYDTSDGYFDPYTYVVYNYNGETKRVATVSEGELILNKYRQEADAPVGYLPNMYEYWTSGRASEIQAIKKNYEKKAEEQSNLGESTPDMSMYSCNFLPNLI